MPFHFRRPVDAGVAENPQPPHMGPWRLPQQPEGMFRPIRPQVEGYQTPTARSVKEAVQPSLGKIQRYPFPFHFDFKVLHNLFVRGSPRGTEYPPQRDLTYWAPERNTIPRIWNPKIKGFKGAKNYGGTNNYESLYLPRVVRYLPRRSTTALAVQLRRSGVSVDATRQIPSVRVPTGLK